MSLRRAIGAALASVVVVLGAGCDSGSDTASPPDDRPAESVPSPPTTQTTETTETTGDAVTTTAGTTVTPTVTSPTDTGVTPDAATSTTPTEPRYRLGPTRRCLVRAGMQVAKVGDADSRLQALGDLAQRTSLEIRDGGDVVGLAITDVELLEDLLAVPNDPYHIETQGNALLLFKPGARDLSRRVRDCLRA